MLQLQRESPGRVVRQRERGNLPPSTSDRWHYYKSGVCGAYDQWTIAVDGSFEVILGGPYRSREGRLAQCYG